MFSDLQSPRLVKAIIIFLTDFDINIFLASTAAGIDMRLKGQKTVSAIKYGWGCKLSTTKEQF